MRDKRCLVLGASGGIGSSVFEFMYECGYEVIGVSRKEERLIGMAEKLGDGAHCLAADLSRPEDIERVFHHELLKERKLDAMIYCAGISRPSPVSFMDAEGMNDTMAVNAFGFVHCCKYFIKKNCSNDGAAVVAVSSMSALDCTMGMCAYSMSKAALNAAVKTISKESARRRIRVNAVLPAYVDTEMSVSDREREKSLQELSKVQPFGVIRPLEVAQMIYYLISDASVKVTGGLFPISGGRVAK